MNILPNKKVLESLIQSKPGEICYVEDEKKYYERMISKLKADIFVEEFKLKKLKQSFNKN